MTNDELKAAWSADITSLEKFNEVLNHTYNWLPRHNNYQLLLPQRDGGHVASLAHGEETWPLRRDFIRELVGFYPEPTSVLRWARTPQSNIGAGQMFPHISPHTNEPGMVSFSPDAHQAKADRKQRMPIGRFLRKFMLYAPDSEIQRLEQQHRSELDTTFKLAETVQAIERVYVGMDGDTGCMRHNRSNFSLTDYHPSAVYASPGMGVAYTEDENGTIKSRSVVWVNPSDASDKRYVRIYGDPILKKKLEMQGYKMLGLAGAKLRILRDSSFTSQDRVVMPWIDPAGGIHAHNVDRSKDSAHAVRYKGEEFFTLVDSTAAARFQRAGIYPVDVQTQNGKVDVPEVDMSGFEFTCPIRGGKYNRMDQESVLWYGENGTIGRATIEGVHEVRDDVDSLNIQHEGRMQRIYMDAGKKDSLAIPGFGTHFNNEATRDAVGVCELDKAFYADSERWFTRSLCVFMELADGVRSYIKKEDAVMLYAESGDKFVHIEMVRDLKKSGCVPVAVLNGFRGLAHKDHKFLKVTGGGKRVIASKHDVTALHDGTWEYTRNVVVQAVAGVSYQVRKDDANKVAVLSDEFVLGQMQSQFAILWRGGDAEHNKELRRSRMIAKLSRGFQGAQAYMKKDDAIVSIDYYNKPTDPQQILEAAQGILVMQDDSEWLRRTLGYNFMRAIPWANAVVQIMRLMKEYDREQEMALAEANAVEAAPSTAAVIEVLNSLGDSDMDRLVAEVDDALATSVIRRWPRLQQVAHNIEHGTPTPMGTLAEPFLRTVQNDDGTLSPVYEPVRFEPQGAALVPRLPVHTPHMDVPIAHPDRIQAAADDELLRELQSVGLAPIVIDESTVFPASALREEV